jgi:hypothetical protein
MDFWYNLWIFDLSRCAQAKKTTGAAIGYVKKAVGG